MGLLRRCRNAAFQSSVRDQFGYLRVLCASPFGGTIPCALLIGSSGCILLLAPSRSDRQLLKRQLTCLTGTYRLPLEYICFLQKFTGSMNPHRINILQRTYLHMRCKHSSEMSFTDMADLRQILYPDILHIACK